MKRLSILPILLAVILPATAQDEEAQETEPAAYVRIQTLLAGVEDGVRYDVKCEEAADGVLFSGLAPIDSRLYVKLPPGNHRMEFVRLGEEEAEASIDLDLDAGEARTILTVEDPESGRVKCLALQDYPIREEEEGLHLYNFLGDSSFRVRVGEGPDLDIPPNPKPIHISPELVVGKVVIFSRISKRGTPIETHIEPDRLAIGARVNVIIARNSYDLPTVDVLECGDPRKMGFGE